MKTFQVVGSVVMVFLSIGLAILNAREGQWVIASVWAIQSPIWFAGAYWWSES